jgi:hypothetical protein
MPQDIGTAWSEYRTLRFTQRSCGLWHSVVLQVDTGHVEEPAACTFRIEMHWVRNCLGYSGRLQETWPLRPMRRDVEMWPRLRLWQKTLVYWKGPFSCLDIWAGHDSFPYSLPWVSMTTSLQLANITEWILHLLHFNPKEAACSSGCAQRPQVITTHKTQPKQPLP